MLESSVPNVQYPPLAPSILEFFMPLPSILSVGVRCRLVF